MDLVRITNTRPTILYLPDQLVKTGAKGPDGTLVDARFVGFDTGKAMGPGGNNVNRAEWEAAKRHQIVRGWLEMGWLIEGGDVSKPEGVEPPKSLSVYGVAASIALIETESVYSTLRQWLETEQR